VVALRAVRALSSHRARSGGAALLFGRVIDTSWVLRPRGARPWHCGWRWFPSPSVRLP